MADVFVSYASSNRERVVPLVAALEAEGWSVWWDRAITGGEAFDRAIEEAIDQARCIVVVWSAESVESEWVRTEANEGLERGILVPVAIDAVRPPLAFRRTQTLDFSAAPDIDGLVAAVLGHVPKVPSVPGVQTELVGREVELAAIDRALQNAKSGVGGLLLLSGEAGVGKTRLTKEAVADARALGLLTLTGYCSEIEGAPPYEPFVEHIEQAVRTIDGDAFRAALGENAPEVAKLMPELRHLYDDIPDPIDLPPDQDRRYLLHGFGEFLERAAATQPMLLVFEDLHWADNSTCIMLRHLVSRLRACPVLLMGTYRNNELMPGSPFARTLRELVRERLCEDINLRRLNRDAVATLLKTRAGVTPPENLVELVYSETEGNPFFVEEVYRNLEESGRLFDSDGNLQSGLTVRDTDVPRGVRLVLEERLNRMSEAGRKALTVAAVSGRHFSFELLVRVTDVGEDALLDVMDEAAAASLVEDISTGREARYQFAHELIRQTLLAGLSFPRRQRMHLRIADALREVAGDARVSEVAHHYYQAGAAADADTTIEYLRRAGERALRTLAFEDALKQLDLALEVVPEEDQETLAQIQVQRARALRGSARVDDALAAYDAALDHKLSDTAYETLLRERARLHVDMYLPAPALPDIDELLERARSRGDQAMELNAQLLLAEARYRISLDTPEVQLPAREATERAIALAREVGDQRALATALLSSTHFVDYWREFREQARENLREAREIGEALRDEDIIIDAETMALRVNLFKPVELNIAMEDVREHLEARRDPLRLREHLFWMIGPTRMIGNFRRSVEVCDQAIDIAASLGLAPVQYPTFKSIALMDLGRFDEAWRSIENETQLRFGKAMQQWGFLLFKAQLGDADGVLAAAPALLTEAKALGRVWMTDSIAEMVAKCGAQTGHLTATQDFLAGALEQTGSKPTAASRAELCLATNDPELAFRLAAREAEHCVSNGMLTRGVEATEVVLRTLAALGRWDDLIERAQEAIDFSDERGFARLQWPLYALRAIAFTNLSDAEQAAADRAQAQAVFDHIAATIADAHIRKCYIARATALGLVQGVPA